MCRISIQVLKLYDTESENDNVNINVNISDLMMRVVLNSMVETSIGIDLGPYNEIVSILNGFRVFDPFGNVNCIIKLVIVMKWNYINKLHYLIIYEHHENANYTS